MLIAGDGAKGFVLWVARKLMLFCSNSEMDGGGTEYAFPQHLQYAPVLDDVDKGPGCVGLRETITEE